MKQHFRWVNLLCNKGIPLDFDEFTGLYFSIFTNSYGCEIQVRS